MLVTTRRGLTATLHLQSARLAFVVARAVCVRFKPVSDFHGNRKNAVLHTATNEYRLTTRTDHRGAESWPV